MRINVTPQQLLAFLRVAETLSFGEAAGQLGLSQPALSRTIKTIEDTVGARLFDRDTRNVALTPAGRELEPIARRIVREFETGFSDLGRFVTGRRGRVVVAALPSMAAVLLPGSIARFRAERPEVEFEIVDAISGSVLDAVAEGRAEIGLTARPTPGRNLVYEPLLSDDFGLVVRSDDPLAERPYNSWQVFADRPFIAMSAGSSVRAITDSAFLECGLAIAPLFSCGFLATARALVHQGLGVTALPGLTVPLMAESGLVWRPLVDPVRRRSLGFVRRTGATLSPATFDFIAQMRREIRHREQDAGLGGGIRSEGDETPAS